MMNRLAPAASPLAAVTSTETHVLDLLIKNNATSQVAKPTLNCYLAKNCQAGRLSRARVKDPPLGNTVMWRGISRLTYIELGFIIAPDLWVIESRRNARIGVPILQNARSKSGNLVPRHNTKKLTGPLVCDRIDFHSEPGIDCGLCRSSQFRGTADPPEVCRVP
jgi:hypothetical protein